MAKDRISKEVRGILAALDIYRKKHKNSIVERLTQMKLELMSNQSDLNAELKNAEQSILRQETELKNWNADIQEDVKRNKRQKELAIEKAKQDFANTKSFKAEKDKVYAEKIKAIDTALKQIEEISKTSPTITITLTKKAADKIIEYLQAFPTTKQSTDEAIIEMLESYGEE